MDGLNSRSLRPRVTVRQQHPLDQVEERETEVLLEDELLI
jgi:hypothetical protein